MDPIPIRLSKELQERVDEMAQDLSISRSAVLRLAIGQWLEAVKQRGINPLLNEELKSYKHSKTKKRNC